MPNFAGLYGEVANQFDSQAVTRAKLWVNQAQHEVNMRRRWSWLESQVTVPSVVGQIPYVLTGTAPVVTDFDGMISVRTNDAAAGTKFQKLRYLRQDDFDDWFAFAQSNTGIPVFYTVRGGTPQTTPATITLAGNTELDIWPASGFIGSLKLAYWRSLASCEMVADTDNPIVPVQYHEAIMLLAVARGLATEDQMIQSNVTKGLAEQIISAAVRADIAMRGGDPSENRPSVGGKLPANPSIADPAQDPYGFDVDR